MKSYADKLKHPKWQEKRFRIMERDGFTCRDCEDAEETLHVHHVRYIRGNDPWDYPDDLLVCLCQRCHAKRPEIENELRLAIDRLMGRLSAAAISDLVWQAEMLLGSGEMEGATIADTKQYNEILDQAYAAHRSGLTT